MPNFFPCRYFPSFIPKSVNNGIPHTALDTHFNPRTRERCNPGTSTLTATSAHFNPYTPCGVRLFTRIGVLDRQARRADGLRQLKKLAIQMAMTTATPVSFYLSLPIAQLFDYADILSEIQKDRP